MKQRIGQFSITIWVEFIIKTIKPDNNHYDIIIIGGGATGMGTAVEAQTRGYRVLLLEAHDFGSGASSKSTKLVHGGIRYLANFDFALVKEGLLERHFLLNNAPHLAKPQTYLVPFYSWWDKLKYLVGVTLYDWLSGTYRIGKSHMLSKADLIQAHHAPQLVTNKLIGGVIYFDGQFDDSRLLISLLRTFQQYGGVAYNYTEVKQIIHDENNIACGVIAVNKLTQATISYTAQVIINATGVLADSIINLDDKNSKHNHVMAAQGSHLVFEKSIFNSPHALVIPKTPDKRILFVLPWHDKIIVGTTDINVDKPTVEPLASNEEVEFILETLSQYTTVTVTRNDILAKFAGLRPLVRVANNKATAKVSRKHEIIMSKSNLVTIVGGKWTIYRLMGEDTINYVISQGLIDKKGNSVTKELKLFGYTTETHKYPLSVYGSEYSKIIEIQQEFNNFNKLHVNLPYYEAEVIYYVRYEMARTVEDVLARRLRALLINAKASIEASPRVAQLMAMELQLDDCWIANQLFSYNAYAKNYLEKD
jgi:glycerol-3-phosphate dehydrogenase